MTNFENIKVATKEQLAKMITEVAFEVLNGLSKNEELMNYVSAGLIEVLGEETPKPESTDDDGN